ncbi:MAG: isochorismatase family protein [Roseiflexaceae bacterium]|nr:isochorismatase family protein [Roseiflexaceae bacterium]
MSTHYVPFTPADAAIILVDHQPGVLAMVKSLPASVVTVNTALLARLGEEMGIPLVITSTRENVEFLGTTLEEVQESAPKAYEQRIQRPGTLNAFHDEGFAAAVAATKRRNLVIGGILTDVCLFNTVVSAVEAGYTVRVVADASGTSTTLGDDVTYDRLRNLGVDVTTTYGILFELYPNLNTPEGQQAEAIATASLTYA